MRHERERSGRCAVEPLRVVDHAQERLLLGGFGEETENREPDEERARRLSGAEPEGDAERVPLRIRQTLAELEDRRTELLQRRVVELHLPLDARSPDDAKILARLDRVLEQCGLADAGVSVHHEDGAVTVPRGTQQPLEHRALALPADEPPRLRAHDHPGSMPPGSGTKDFLDSTNPGGGQDDRPMQAVSRHRIPRQDRRRSSCLGRDGSRSASDRVPDWVAREHDDSRATSAAVSPTCGSARVIRSRARSDADPLAASCAKARP